MSEVKNSVSKRRLDLEFSFYLASVLTLFFVLAILGTTILDYQEDKKASSPLCKRQGKY